MTVDISKVFKANVKALRINSGDDRTKIDALNEELLNKKRLKKEKETEVKIVTKQVVTEANCIVIWNTFLLTFEIKRFNNF